MWVMRAMFFCAGVAFGLTAYGHMTGSARLVEAIEAAERCGRRLTEEKQELVQVQAEIHAYREIHEVWKNLSLSCRSK